MLGSLTSEKNCRPNITFQFFAFEIIERGVNSAKRLYKFNTAGFSIRAGSWRNSPAISHELIAYLIEKLPHIL